MSSATLSRVAVLILIAVHLDAQSARRVAPAGIPVRFMEGSAHGFLMLKSEAGKALASGDLVQIPNERGIESKMTFRFADSSFFEESVQFSQHGVFSLQTYHLIQRGPAFEMDLDATFSANGEYRVKATSHSDRKVKEYTGKFDLPPDVSNGMVITLLKNFARHDTQTVHMVAFLPAPKVVQLLMAPVRESSVMNGNRTENSVEFDLKPKPGALAGFFGGLLGKIPADTHVWLVTGEAPAFIRSAGPLYTGPVWRIELTVPGSR